MDKKHTNDCTMLNVTKIICCCCSCCLWNILLVVFRIFLSILFNSCCFLLKFCSFVLRYTGFTISSFGHVSWARCTLSSTCELITSIYERIRLQICFFSCNRHLFDDSMAREMRSMMRLGVSSYLLFVLMHSKKIRLK